MFDLTVVRLIRCKINHTKSSFGREIRKSSTCAKFDLSLFTSAYLLVLLLLLLLLLMTMNSCLCVDYYFCSQDGGSDQARAFCMRYEVIVSTVHDIY